MKRHSLTKILAVILLLIIIASYFFEGRQGISYIAVGDVALNYFQAFYYFFDTALFILVVGAFYGLLDHIPAYAKLQKNIASKVKNSKKLIFLIITIFVLISSLTGLNLILLIFIPFVISLILTMGYDKLVALFSTVGAVTMGLIGGIFTTFRDPLDYYGASFTTFEKFVGLKNMYVNIIPKIGLLFIATLMLMFFVNKHIKKMQKKETEVKIEKLEKKETEVKVEKIEKKELVSKEESQKEINEMKKETKKEIKPAPKKNTNKKNSKETKINQKKSSNKKNLSAAKQEETIIIKPEKKIKTWPLILLLTIIFIILVLGYMPWSSLFNITIFDEFHAWLTEQTFDDLHIYILVIFCLIFIITIINFIKKVLKEKKISKIILNIILMLIELVIIEIFAIYTFNIKLFGLDKIIKSFEIWNSSVFNTLISKGVASFGNWGTVGNYMMAIIILILFIIIIKVIYRIKFSDMLDYCGEGMKKMLPSMLVAMLAYTVLITAYNNGLIETIIGNAIDKFGDNIMIHSLITIVGSIINVDLYYTSAGIFSTITNGLSAKADLKIFAIAFQSLYGLVQLIGPTSILLITCLTYTEVSYKDWFKNIWRLVLGLFIIIFAAILIVSLI